MRSWNWVRFKEYTPASKYYFLKHIRDYLDTMIQRLAHFEEKASLGGWATLTDEDYAIYEVENPFDLLQDYRERIELPQEKESRETVTNNLNLLIWLSLRNDEDYKGKPNGQSMP